MKYENNLKFLNIVYIAVIIFQYNNQSEHKQELCRELLTINFTSCILSSAVMINPVLAPRAQHTWWFGFQRLCKSFIAKKANSKHMHSERTVILTWKALLSMCSPSFAPSKFTIICLPYKFLRVWKCLLTEEKFHTHLLAHRRLTPMPATLRSYKVFNINFIHTFQQSIERHKQSLGSSHLC